MPRHTPFAAALVLAGVAAATSGCLGFPDAEADPVRPAVTPSVSRSPAAPPAKDDVVAALTKLMSAQYTFHVVSNLPSEDDGKVDASGGFDHAGKIYEENVTITGGKYPGHIHRIVFDKDLYSRADEKDKWVHLDLARAKHPDYDGVDMENPTGLPQFTSGIVSATKTGPTSYKGLFDPMSGEGEFLPVGHPSIVAFYTKDVPFTMEVDAQGNVTAVHVEMEQTDKPAVVMDTTFANHGKPLATQRPAKNKTGEADDMYYR
ncbi:hypothetical protein ACQP00_32520 [Dactylosporangium sp. CS-047395]|uniref:hypothetical protein n=1 Tax=Dactylosporangium sp. CS-047395 TaxID=3239936 RepID=UPI003D939744